MPQFECYLIFDGTCAEAVRFYEQTLGARIERLMTFAESPVADKMPAGSSDRIMHARLVLDGGVLMASDSMAGDPQQGMRGFSIAIAYDDVAEAQRIFDALAASGRIVMAMGKTFWAESFGMLVDRFGTPWMVSGGRAPG